MSEPRPKLVAVGGDPRRSGPPSRPESPPAVSRRTFALVLTLAALAGLALAVQTQRVDLLSAEVERLTGELEVAQQVLSAYEGQLGRVRASIGELREQLAELEAIVGPDPTAQTPSEAP